MNLKMSQLLPQTLVSVCLWCAKMSRLSGFCFTLNVTLSVAYSERTHRCQKSDTNTEKNDNTPDIFRNDTSNSNTVQNIVHML